MELSAAETIRVTAMRYALDSFEIVPSAEQLVARAKQIEKFIKGEEE